jgi:hypothetical protein
VRVGNAAGETRANFAVTPPFLAMSNSTSETSDSDTVFEDMNRFDKEVESGDEVSDVWRFMTYFKVSKSGLFLLKDPSSATSGFERHLK